MFVMHMPPVNSQGSALAPYSDVICGMLLTLRDRLRAALEAAGEHNVDLVVIDSAAATSQLMLS